MPSNPETTIQRTWLIVRPLIRLGMVAIMAYGAWQASAPERLTIMTQWQSGDPIIRIILLMMIPVAIAGLLYAIADSRSLARKLHYAR